MTIKTIDSNQLKLIVLLVALVANFIFLIFILLSSGVLILVGMQDY